MVDWKKGAMLVVWRFQQVNSLVIIVGLSMTLTLQVYPYVGWWFESMGIPHKLDWLIMIIIFGLTFTGAVIFGILYDVVFKLWIPQMVVTTERTPYAKEKMAAKPLLNKRYFFIPMLRQAGLKNEAAFNTMWIERNLKEDKILKRDVEKIIAWVNEYELKPADKRWLKDVEKIMNKPYAPKSETALKKGVP
jgi:hypothetical protein